VFGSPAKAVMRPNADIFNQRMQEYAKKKSKKYITSIVNMP
jgi:hypothetical protein